MSVKENNKRRKDFKRNKDVKSDYTIKNGSNDVHWYGNDDVINLAGKLSFFKSLGTEMNQFTQVAAPGTIVRNTIAGIMFIEILDTLPTSSASLEVDAINIAAKQQYALIRKANSGAKNYEWNDLIIYEMARSSLNEIYAFLCRAYGVSCTYSMQNRYLPRTLLTGMGFDPDDFISNLASIRLFINNLGKRINTLALPHSLTYFERKAWLYSHIFTDSASAKAQYYVLTPGGNIDTSAIGNFLLYDATALSTGGCLRPHSIFQGGNVFSNWSQQVNVFVDALLADDDAAIISGDILKAYGEDRLFKCNPIPEDYSITPVCDYEVLSQIENLTVAPEWGPRAVAGETDSLKIAAQKGWIVQDGAGNLMATPNFKANPNVNMSNLYARDPVLNYHKTDVTPADVMVGTRLTVQYGPGVMGSDNNYNYSPTSCGTEIVTRLVVYYSPSNPPVVFQGAESTGTYSTLAKMFDITVFDWCPKILFFAMSGSTVYIIPPLGDYETYRVITHDELKKLHDTAVLYMFGVPLIENYAK